jgi:hypothetical protein
MRKKLKENEKKVKLTCTINPIIFNKVNELHSNVSKHIEWLIYQDLRKHNQIDETIL